MGQGKDLPWAAYKADELEMEGSTNTPKMQSPSLLQVSAGPMSLLLLPWSSPGLHLLAGGELGSLGLCHHSPHKGPRQGKENGEEKGGRGVTSWDKCKLPPHHRKTTWTRFSSAALGERR